MNASSLKLPLFYIVISLVLLLLYQAKILNPFLNITQMVTVPIQYAAFSFRDGIEDQFSVLTFWRSGESRIRQLEQRNAELTAKAAQVEGLERENQELKNQLGSKALPVTELIPVAIVGFDHDLVIGAGSNQGVKVGQAVIYLDNLVGKVNRVEPRVSFVQLPNDGSAKIPCKIKLVRCISSGQFNSTILLDRVTQTEEVVSGDIVQTSGQEGLFPPNLVIGKVGKILSTETDLFVQAQIEPVIDYSKLTTVFLLP